MDKSRRTTYPMRVIRTSLYLIFFILVFSGPLSAQFFENFDDGSKGSYAGASVTLSTGNWFFEDALLGNLDNDKCNGTKCVRMDRGGEREGSIYMQFDKEGGVDELSFVFANYGDETGGKLQVQYSIDQGSSWTNIGNEYTATSSLEKVTILVNIDEPIRFKFIQSGGSGRLNLDDVLITDFITPEIEATIKVSVAEKTTVNESSINYGLVPTNSTVSKILKIQNIGTPDLQISDLKVNGEGFTVSDLGKSTLAFKEKVEIIVSFNPTNLGEYSGELTIISNSASNSTFSLNLSGANFTKDQTFDVVTWNIEWFGDTGKGPDNEDLQLQNVVKVIETIDAEIYAIQEIASPSRFAELVDNLEDYGGFLSDFSQDQETAFLFKRANVDSLSGITLSSDDGFTRSNWANGRYPLMFRMLADVNGEEQEFYIYNIHAKAFGDEGSYNQRLNASAELKSYLDTNRSLDNVVILGDYNDEILTSTFSGSSSPYSNFDEDVEYTILTKNLEDQGFVSHSSSSFNSFLDHITISSELSDEYLEGSERVENTTYVQDYLSTTSDHYPVLARFRFGLLTSNDDEDLQNPTKVTLAQNYPNPFNPSTTITYTLDTASEVSLVVYDITGRKVSTLINGRQAAGAQQVSFDASSLASGIYIYRLETAMGVSLTKKMVLIK